jgi:hypothetical protein
MAVIHVPPGHVVKCCVAVDELAEPYVPSELRVCDGCGCDVWSDPNSSVPALGPEFILCYRNESDSCFDTWGRSLPRRRP